MSTSGGPVATSASWELLPSPMPRASDLVTCAAIPSQRKIVVLGDHLHHHVFDTARHTWEELPLLPTRRLAYGLVSYNDTIIAVGGGNFNGVSNAVHSIVLESGGTATEWQSLPFLLTRRSACGTSVVEDSIVVSGGYGGGTHLRTAEMYDINRGEWTRLPNMLEARSSRATACVGNRFFVFGGFNGSVLNTAECFHLSSRTWESLPTMPRCRRQGAAVAVGHLVLLVGGLDENRNLLDAVDCFDTVTNQWMDGPTLQTARTQCGVAAMDGEVYVFGGRGTDGDLDTIERVGIDPYRILVRKLLLLFHQENVPLGLWAHILAVCPPSVAHFVLLSERFQLDSVLSGLE